MWLRLRPLLQSEKETRQEMASWTKAADEGHETVARHGMSPVSGPTFLVLHSRTTFLSSWRRIDMKF
ncbi:hypothetical protein BKA67DRAFT_585779 [Truncatella angustata]|uniref:Uncharacterized protein n=1 Tax=Truncatella angustata TaxID=152316 RepID=A0A9P8UBN2_9PEZI|nr:uncharacterized protein BKA67DRAFT_585779 [Truncatella angustata]KAH6645606.1 hypothetical protein BKA67DRAFT_585779 [Truncatella angustata]